MRRLWSLLLCFALLFGLLVLPTRAADSLEQQISKFMEDHKLSEENFSLSYSSGNETYSFHADRMLPAGQLWMLPLHMYFCEQESMGAYEPEYEWSEEFTIGGLTLKECRYESLLQGNETAALSMQDYLGGHRSFKLAVNEAFGHLNESQITENYLTGNYYSARFWMNCFRELTDHPGIYDDLSRNYSIVQTADALAGFDRHYAVFQLRGEEDGWVTAMAKVWTAEPYLLVCSIRSPEADALLAELNGLICDYTAQSYDPEAQFTTPTTENQDLSITVEKTDHTGEKLRWIGFAVGGALLLVALVAVPVLLRRRKQDDEYYD